MDTRQVSLSDALLPSKSSLRNCLAAMHLTGFDTAFLVDSESRLIGAVTAEDVRAALVNGSDIDSCAGDLVTEPAVVTTKDDTRSRVIDVMRAVGVSQVPVVDDSGRVVGLHAANGMIGTPHRRNWAVIIAGGFGKRLAPVTNTIPKPMVRVAGRPILEHLILHLASSGIRRILVSVNYLGHMIQEYFGDGSAFGCAIEYLWDDEDQPLGTGGPLRLLCDFESQPDEPLLVLNGDLVTGFAVGKLLDAHAARGAVATIAASEYHHEVPFGVVENENGWLRRIAEKPVHTWPVNSGIYVLEPFLLSRVPKGKLYPITNLFEECLERGEPVGVWRMDDPWQDVGKPEELARARGQR
ncbi:nucleotidyltransferase family protein [Haloechinothrix salitolerans]|uniref:Nucleotidyltransferase family protein n=1 Tax=Haloechinothrix salitolerans TaxID=926830 RepID=A0ABW2BTB3_9PSEU